MKVRSLVSFFLLSTLVILLLSTAVQATEHKLVKKEPTDVIAEEVLKQRVLSTAVQLPEYKLIKKEPLVLSYEDDVHEYRKVKAEEVLKDIENGEDVYLKNCNVVGELDVSKIKLENTPNSYYDKLVNEGFDKEWLISNGVHENLGIIESNITIRNSIFENNVNFSNVLFNSRADFADTNFNSFADFSGTNFNSLAVFANTDFYNSANFLGTNFNSLAEFVSTSFSGSVDFSCTNFNDFTRFNFGNFDSSADFSGVTYNDNVDFTGVVFNGSANFVGTNFKSYSLFEWTMFNDSADFSGASFDAAYFDTEFNDPANFEVPDTSENIFTDGKTCEVFRKSYIDEARYVDADNIYYNFRLYSHEKDFQEDSQERELLSISKWADVISWIFFGYGLKPARTLLVGGIIVVSFSIVYWKGSGIYRSSDTSDKMSKVSGLDALLFSIREFTTLGSSDWYPRDNFRILVTLEGLLGWIILGIFMATLTNVMIRS